MPRWAVRRVSHPIGRASGRPLHSLDELFLHLHTLRPPPWSGQLLVLVAPQNRKRPMRRKPATVNSRKQVSPPLPSTSHTCRSGRPRAKNLRHIGATELVSTCVDTQLHTRPGGTSPARKAKGGNTYHQGGKSLLYMRSIFRCHSECKPAMCFW